MLFQWNLCLTVECPAFIWLQRHRKWLGDIRDIGDTVSPLGILRLINKNSFPRVFTIERFDSTLNCEQKTQTLIANTVGRQLSNGLGPRGFVLFFLNNDDEPRIFGGYLCTGH